MRKLADVLVVLVHRPLMAAALFASRSSPLLRHVQNARTQSLRLRLAERTTCGRRVTAVLESQGNRLACGMQVAVSCH